MTRLKRLQNEALGACKFRGHTMQRFHRVLNRHKDVDNSLSEFAYANCTKPACNMQVCVHTNPQPNEINISGEAVALTCIV